MPLNPPSYLGHDVWYSPDVYVNRVPVALWQPPQIRMAAEQITPALILSIEGEDIQFQDNGTQANNQANAYAQQLVKSGVITQEAYDRMKNAKPNGSEASQSLGDRNTKITSKDTGGAEYQTLFPPNYQMSQEFTLGELVQTTDKNPDHWYLNEKIGTFGTGGLKPGQLVANGKLLAANCLDPIKRQFPDFWTFSTIRAATNSSQHGKFQACDFSRRSLGFKSNYDTACWILKSTIPFDQLILEYGYGGSWVHISYADPPTITGPRKVMTAHQAGNTFTVLAMGKIVNMDSQFLTRNF